MKPELLNLGDYEFNLQPAIEIPEKCKYLLDKMDLSEKEWNIYRNSLATIESNGFYEIKGGYNNNYDGRYQLGLFAKKDACKILNLNISLDKPEDRRKFRKDYKNYR